MNKRHRSPMPLRVKAVTLAVASCFAVSVQTTAFANPTGFAVVNGQVTFNYNGNTLNVTNTPGSIINWQRFSIGSNELTRFIQQSAASSVLNRVVGIDPSLILGALQSNGRVFLINPNGILFGAGAQIDVGGLVASTLNLSNQDFLAGRLRFTATPGAGSLVNNAAISPKKPDGARLNTIETPQGMRGGCMTLSNGTRQAAPTPGMLLLVGIASFLFGSVVSPFSQAATQRGAEPGAVVFENDKIVVRRYLLQPGTSTGMHSHGYDYLERVAELGRKVGRFLTL